MYSFWQSMIDSVIIKKVVAVPKDAGATFGGLSGTSQQLTGASDDV